MTQFETRNVSNLPWSKSQVEFYVNKWDWSEFSANESIHWSEELIERYEDKCWWIGLSRNTSLPWSEKLIERYAEKWDWDGIDIPLYGYEEFHKN